MDNCFRENKNKYLFGYLSYLVQCGIFNMIEVSFLPVGHTHEDIDQFFSRIAIYLHYHNAITENELTEAIGNCISPNPRVKKLENIANFKKYIIEQKWLKPITGISINFDIIIN